MSRKNIDTMNLRCDFYYTEPFKYYMMSVRDKITVKI